MLSRDRNLLTGLRKLLSDESLSFFPVLNWRTIIFLLEIKKKRFSRFCFSLLFNMDWIMLLWIYISFFILGKCAFCSSYLLLMVLASNDARRAVRFSSWRNVLRQKSFRQGQSRKNIVVLYHKDIPRRGGWVFKGSTPPSLTSKAQTNL